VLDLHMPGVSGFDVQARLAQSRDSPPVVVITGQDTPESRQRVMDGGAAAFLRKPVIDRVLLDAIASAIAERARDEPT
jgi:FixJ family two-component response regulator